MSLKIGIGGTSIGAGAKAFIIAEVAQAHDGSLGLAHSFIDAAADAKANAIKFQTHVAAEESTREEPFRVLFSQQDATRYDYWRRIEFAPDQWAGLAEHARTARTRFSDFRLFTVRRRTVEQDWGGCLEARFGRAPLQRRS